MLLELHVENYAVVEKLRVRFHPGLNVLTGETGSGKSIVVDALGLLFGGRASAGMLRSGSNQARISGIFEASPAGQEILQRSGIEAEDGEILIEREILAEGKSRAYAGGRPATLALLRELAPILGDIHGQHDQQRLFDSASQLEILDAFAGAEGQREEAARAYREWRRVSRELEELAHSEGEKLRMLDLWSFQLNEIESAQLKPGEDVELENERRVLQNVGKLIEAASSSYEALYDAPESACAAIRQAVRRLEDLCRVDEKLSPVVEALKPAHIAVDEAAAALRDYIGELEADPQRLEEIEERLAAIHKLKRKYGGSVEEILAFLEDVRARAAAVETATARRADLEKQQVALAQAFERMAADLHAVRSKAATVLAKRVQTELKSLAMGGTVFEVRLTPAEWSETGADAAEFFVSANVGEEPRPLDKVASGGELSRIALALKTCAETRGRGRTLVFDEVDAGIGGSAAEAVGRRLKALSGRNQVLCVTHLAQIAGFADHHFAVGKREVNGRTVADLEELSGDARTREIGRMLAGQRLTPEALKHAEQLIRLSSEE